MDLFAYADQRDAPACAPCMHLDPKPIDSGVRFCWRGLGWRFPANPACDAILLTGPSGRPPFAREYPNQVGVSALDPVEREGGVG